MVNKTIALCTAKLKCSLCSMTFLYKTYLKKRSTATTVTQHFLQHNKGEQFPLDTHVVKLVYKKSVNCFKIRLKLYFEKIKLNLQKSGLHMAEAFISF